jgi:hypothetical protein
MENGASALRNIHHPEAEVKMLEKNHRLVRGTSAYKMQFK